jgi:hypothetical protein
MISFVELKLKHTKLSALHFYYMYKHVYVLENFFYLKRQFCLYKKKTLKITNIKQNKSCFASACSELKSYSNFKWFPLWNLSYMGRRHENRKHSLWHSEISCLKTPNQVVLNSLKGNQMDLIVYPYMTKL